MNRKPLPDARVAELIDFAVIAGRSGGSIGFTPGELYSLLREVQAARKLREYVGNIIDSWEAVLTDDATAAANDVASSYDASDVAEEALTDLAALAAFIGRPIVADASEESDDESES